MAGDGVVDSAALARDFERVRAELRELLAAAGDADLARASEGTRWSNEELLFHMVFGYMVVLRLLVLVRILARLPDRVGRGFAALLDAGTRPFHLINYYGARGGALVYDRRRMAAKLDRVIAKLQRRLARERDTDFRLAMAYPTRWDPYFRDHMTVADIYRYPRRHFDHHRRQLTLGPRT